MSRERARPTRPSERQRAVRVDRPSSGGNPAVRWLLLDGGRPTVVGGLTLGVFLAFVALGATGVVDVGNSSLVSSAFTAAITGVFTLVSITISINQLVLSRVLGSPEHIEERIESVHRFRSGVEAMAPRVSVSPTEPAAFLAVLTGVLRDRSRDLESTYGRDHDPRLVAAVDELVETLHSLADGVEDELGSRRLDLFSVLSPVLDDSYSQHLHSVSRIEAESTDLDDDERRAFEELASVLDEVDRTRHYFKSLYIHEELAGVSRLMLLTGVPALVLCFAVVLAAGDGAAPVAAGLVGVAAVSAAIAVVFVPLAVLFAYGLRLATIAKRTTTFGTFTPVEELP